MKNLSVDPDHQSEVRIPAGNVFGRIAEGIGTAEFLESDQIRMVLAQGEEQIRVGLEPVVGTVVNDRGLGIPGIQNG